LGTLVLQAVYIGATNRRAVRALLGVGLGAMLFAQAFVISGGTFGMLPLTGIVVPFLSAGGSSMVVFIGTVALLHRLAQRGRPPAKAVGPEHHAWRSASWALAGALVVAGVWGAAPAHTRCVSDRDAPPLRVGVTLGRSSDARVILDPRLPRLARRIPRGAIRDRDEVPLAQTDASGVRKYPLGASLGTLLGWADVGRRYWRPAWAFEARAESKLRALDAARPVAIAWLAVRGKAQRVLAAYPAGRDEGPPEVELRDGEALTRKVFSLPDYTPMLRLQRLPAAEQRVEVERVIAAEVDRSVQLSLHAGLQQRVAAILRAKVRGAVPAAAAAVIDVDSGEVLARAQWPDFDPAKLVAERARWGDRFAGVYGPLADKTGDRGRFQPGSVSKVFTALAALRVGMPITGAGCTATSGWPLLCEDTHQGRAAYFGGWNNPLKDFGRRTHGSVELAKGLEKSCNVYFAQLGLKIGPGPFVALRDAGVAMGPMDYDPGSPGTRRLASTAIGQGAAWLNVVEAARLVATVASGGRYRNCGHLQRAPCSERTIIADPQRLAPVVAGMRRVVRGLARRGNVREPEGIRVYGKTGTAQDPVKRAEEAFGVPRGSRATHAWFAGFAEPERQRISGCAVQAPGRIAFAVLLLRGGVGGRVAAPAAFEVINAIRAEGFLH